MGSDNSSIKEEPENTFSQIISDIGSQPAYYSRPQESFQQGDSPHEEYQNYASAPYHANAQPSPRT